MVCKTARGLPKRFEAASVDESSHVKRVHLVLYSLRLRSLLLSWCVLSAGRQARSLIEEVVEESEEVEADSVDEEEDLERVRCPAITCELSLGRCLLVIPLFDTDYAASHRNASFFFVNQTII